MSFLGIGGGHAGGSTSPEPDSGTPGKKADHKKLAYISVAVGVVGAIIAYLAYRNSSSTTAAAAAAASPTTSATGTSGSGTIPYSSMDGSDSSYYQAILNAIAGLNPTTTTTTTAPVTTTPVTTTPVPPTSALTSEFKQGSGYFWGTGAQSATPVQETSGNKATLGEFFTWLTPAAAKADPSQQAYYQPSAGNFVPITAANAKSLGSGTPNYVPLTGQHGA